MAKLNTYKIVVEEKTIRTYEVTARTRTEAAMAFASDPDPKLVSTDLADQKVQTPTLLVEDVEGDAPSLFPVEGPI